MIRKPIRWLVVSVILLMLIVLPAAQADDGNYYNFDYEDYWREYKEWGYPAGTRLPCNGGGSEAACTWAWKPWYEHGTDIPRFWSEQYTGRTVSGYALMMYWYGSWKNLHGGVFRWENVTPGHVYCFTMWARSGLDAGNPASTNARMRVGISSTGDYPYQIVLDSSRINAINWSPESNSQYAYARLGVAAKAQGSTLTMFTRAHTDANNQPYTFWDEGTFTEIPLVSVNPPLPPSTGGITITGVLTSTGSVTVSWNTGATLTLGQLLYRLVGSTETITTTVPPTMTGRIYLPFVTKTAGWQASSVGGAWATIHQMQLTGLSSKSIYEYVVVSYGYVNGACGYLISDTTTPGRFQTP